MAIPVADVPKTRLRLLLDSNVVIAVEPFAGTLEPGLPAAANLVRLANEQGHLLCVASATRDDLLEGAEPARRTQRLAELQKFHQLAEVPLSTALVERAGSSEPGSNDHRDLRLLAAVDAGAATYLVTDDNKLRRRAGRAGLAEAVLSLPEAVDLLEGFACVPRSPPPRVSRIPAYALDTEQLIFAGLRVDYPEFDGWLKAVRRDSDNRICLVIERGDQYAALALLKHESDCGYGFDGPVMKISTFKVAGQYAGVKYGELLLKAILMEAAGFGTSTLYVEVLPRHAALLAFLGDFGFEVTPHRTGRGELVLAKHRKPGPESAALSDLEFHVAYGPPALRPTQRIWVVPILPLWHDQLFPELKPGIFEEQLSLFAIDTPEATHPWGNALRKAYLCNSNTGGLGPGDVLLFYRSHDSKSVAAVGMVEATVRSQAPDEVMTFVGRRTVYSPDEITELCRSVNGVLAIRFRQDRFIDPPWSLAELQHVGVLRTWPQSINEVPKEGRAWVQSRLSE